MDAHPLSFSLSFHTLISLSAPVAWQSLFLALTSIDGHLHSPLISHVDVRLSSFFVFSTQPPTSYSILLIVLYPWLADRWESDERVQARGWPDLHVVGSNQEG